MTIRLTRDSANGTRQRIELAGKAPLFTDLPLDLGGAGADPEPHDYFDAALGSCKALTVTYYAQKNGIPLTGVDVDVTRDDSEERKGHYRLDVKLTLRGALTDEQRATLLRIADKCPLHKLMTQVEVSIETRLAEGDFSQ
ncbi:OsmC family protein [Pseudomonas sp. BN417]|uniref:OsmC family protein n=1 Tax=unclassified Pseudomonas TaxID=196821 RepID=UPI0024590EC6|nr:MULTISPECIES: OsmC family protein [unclassified Pseudomonas]MDH4554163.1 OsmC family protein [Pseudomonas sp. BN417]MDH4609435.1 OsmC family protein [Pseudomonas sp. BN102]